MKTITNIQEVSSKVDMQSDSNTVKDSYEFGLKVAKSIESDWFRGDEEPSSNNRFHNRWLGFDELRRYAKGTHSTAKFKQKLIASGDLSYINIDWSPLPVIPKFVDLIVNGMADRLYEVKAYAQDATSQSNRSKYNDLIRGQAAAKPVLDIVQKESGLNPYTVDPSNLPASDDEAALFMQMNYKPAIEIAQETAINTVMDDNNHLELRNRITTDITEIGMAVGRHEFNGVDGVKLRYVNPAYFIHSENEDDPFYSDLSEAGEVKMVHVNEVYKYKPDITKDELNELAMKSYGWAVINRLHDVYDYDSKDTNYIPFLYFNYKTTRRYIKKKRNKPGGGSSVIVKDDTFNPSPEDMEKGNFEKIEKVLDVWYDGVLVLGTDIVLKWEIEKNLVRPDSATQKVISNYFVVAPKIYKGEIDSTVKRMMSLSDLIQLTHFKLQIVLARVVPDGIFLDADGLTGIELGNGQSYDANKAIDMYFETGSVIGRSYTGDGDNNAAKIPVKELTSNSGSSKIQSLFITYDKYLGMMKDLIGSNDATDASTPHHGSLVGVQKMAALNSNVATRHIREGGLYMMKQMAQASSYRIADILQHSDFKEEFINKIGKYNVSILEDIKDLYLYSFGINLEVEADAEEKAKFEERVNTALTKTDINLEDAIDISLIKNLKLANQMLKLKRVKKQEKEQQNEAQKQAIQAQSQQQSQVIAAKAAQAKQVAEVEGKKSVNKDLHDQRMAEMKEAARLKRDLMKDEFNYDQERIKAEQGLIDKREEGKELGKSKRISQQNTEASALIDQKANAKPPVAFQSEENTLDGFDFNGMGN
tara:strand:+ start:4056 stop:6503 length:2448 start_codon:yes stop_codon:yes gene_type:complete